jgi:hypothetical protein
MSRGMTREMGKGMSVLRRVTGMGSAGSLALALLAGGGVLAATAGPRQAQATGTRALQQTMDGVAPLDQTIVVGSSWARVNAAMESATGNMSDQNLTRADVDDVTTQLRRDFSTGPLPLAPKSTDWLGMNPGLYSVVTALPSLDGIPAKLEVTYRYPVVGHLRLVAGRMPATAPRPTSSSSQEVYDLQVVVTPQTARKFALRPGSQLTIGGLLNITMPGKLTVVRLDVTGIVEPADPRSSFWNADPLLEAPALDRVGGGAIWEGAVIADPGEMDMVQRIFGQAFLLFQWELPADTTRLHGQAQALYNQVNQLTNRTPALTGPLAPMANALGVSSGLVQPLAAFVQASNDVNVLLWIVYAGLAVAGVVTLLLAARMIAARRSAELTVRRARGASLAQLFWLGTCGAAVACVPAAALAWAAAVLLVRGAAPAGAAAWWPGIVALALAATGPGAAAAWQHRLPRRRGARRRWPWLPRVVFEVTACAAAVGGITVFRTQPGATGLYASAAPVLVAVPAVIVALRLYQVLLRALARASTQRRGVIGFLGLTRAAQAPVTLALPAMTLVLALTLAAFTGMVRTARHQPLGRACDRRGTRSHARRVGPAGALDHFRWRAGGGRHRGRPGQLRGPGRFDGGVLRRPSRSAHPNPRSGRHPGAGVPPGGRLSRRGRRQHHLRAGGPAGAASPGLRRTAVHPGAAGRRRVHRAATVGDSRRQRAAGEPDAAHRAVNRHDQAQCRGAGDHAGCRRPGHHHEVPRAAGADRGTAPAGHISPLHPGHLLRRRTGARRDAA